MMLALALALLAPSELPSAALVADAGDPVRLWISGKGVFNSGDPVRVQVETGRAGHLMVLQLDPSGRVRVLFPVQPGDDPFVQANRRYELRQPGEGASFVAADGGVGLIFAALAEDPYRLEPLVTTEGEWSTAGLTIAREAQDPEAELTAIVQRVASERGFDYDVIDYQVAGRIADKVEVPAWWSPGYGAVADCMGCGGWANDGVYINVGFGWGWPYYGDPWYWGFGWGYGYYPGYYPPYYPGYYPPYYPGYYPPYYPGYYPGAYIKGRPRGYTVEPYGGHARPHDPKGEPARGGSTTPARRARPRPPESSAGGVDAGSSGGRGNQPSAGTSGGSTGKAGGSTGKSGGSGGRARPRGGRPASESRIASGPTIERERPTAGGQGGWIRVDDQTVPARQGGTRITGVTEPSSVGVSTRPRATGAGTISGGRFVPEARRVASTGSRSFGLSATPRARGGEPRQAAAAAQGGSRSGGGVVKPSAGGARGGGSVARPAPSSGSRPSGASRPSGGGGGGGRSRGRP